MAKDTQRLDIVVQSQTSDISREKAKALIMAGSVYLNGQKADKAGTPVKKTDVVEVRGAKLKYVSRGGLKLEKAMENFTLNLDTKVCMDIGASTGGFTDCMLQNGARRVYAVDVGYGQLAWKLRCDQRVINLERTNVRYLEKEQVNELCDFISVDVSFISLKLVLPVAYKFLKENGLIVALIKPQFEAGRENVGKNGVVRDEKVHYNVIKMIFEATKKMGFAVEGMDFSPVKGPKGNIEYLILLKKSDETSIDEAEIKNIVSDSHKM